MCQIVADHLGATLVNPGHSNEAIWNNRRILIKSAHYGNPEIGTTVATIDRVEAIIAALEDPDGLFTLYEITPEWFKKEMSKSKSTGALQTMMVKNSGVREIGIHRGRIQDH